MFYLAPSLFLSCGKSVAQWHESEAFELERNFISITGIFYKADNKETAHRIAGFVKDKIIEQINKCIQNSRN